MKTIEIVLIVCAVLTPLVALLVLPKKIKKKEEKPKETKTNEVEKKEEVVKEQEKPKEELEINSFSTSADKDLASYRDYLKTREVSSRPVKKLEFNGKQNSLTEDYRAFMERLNKKQEKNKYDVTELSDEMKAFLILGILDRKE